MSLCKQNSSPRHELQEASVSLCGYSEAHKLPCAHKGKEKLLLPLVLQPLAGSLSVSSSFHHFGKPQQRLLAGSACRALGRRYPEMTSPNPFEAGFGWTFARAGVRARVQRGSRFSQTWALVTDEAEPSTG